MSDLKSAPKLKISVITVVLNGHEHIQSCIDSVRSQTYAPIEHIIIDGGSTDGTLDIIQENADRLQCWISEPDKGLYDAMNKGLALASGDIIGFLHADDLFFDLQTVLRIARVFEDPRIDGCYGDLLYMKKDLSRIVRTWRAGIFTTDRIRRGWMLPHPTLYLRRALYDRLGQYRTDFRISADYEFILRLLTDETAALHYLPHELVMMRQGGQSNRGLCNLLRKSLEDHRAWKLTGLPPNPLLTLRKPAGKIRQYFHGETE